MEKNLKNFVIYGLFDENNKLFYIGKGNKKRLKSTIYSKNNNLLKKNKINKVKKITGKNPTIKIFLISSEEYCFDIEKKLIKLYGRKDNKTGILCNCTDGGEGASGQVFTEERKDFHRKFLIKNNPMNNLVLRKKVSESKLGNKNPMFGKTPTIQTREKISKAISGKNHIFFGTHRAESTKIKISNKLKGRIPSWKGKVRTQEHIEKLRQSRCKFIYTIISPTKETFKENSLNLFCKKNNLNSSWMHQVCKGKIQSHKGWIVTKEPING